MGISVYPAPSSSKTLKTVRYTTSGTTTFTLPSGYGVSNPLVADITIVGAGGSAGKGYYTALTNRGMGGGGGGGGYFQQTVQLTANMFVNVGRGGASANWYHDGGITPGFGSNGGTSYVSTAHPANYFINPAGVGVLDSYTIEAPYGPSFGVSSSPTAPAGVGSSTLCYTTSRWNDIARHFGPTFQVEAGVDYCYSAYFHSGSFNSTFTITLTWLQSDGTFISNTNATGQTTTAGNWSRRHNGATAPANAAYCRIMLNRTAGTSSTFNIYGSMFERGVTTPSTYVDGDSTGYRYAGSRAGSVTMATSATYFIASGGGGGIGHDYGSSYAEPGKKGLAGASGGGGGYFTSSTTTDWSLYGGHGGGAGGHAEPYVLIMDSDNGSTQLLTSWGRTKNNTMSRYSELGEGVEGNYVTVGTSNRSQLYFGAPGIGLNGYGRGGFGAYVASAPNQQLTASDAEILKAAQGKNFGDGGDSIAGYNGSTYANYSGKGADGLVIISYWE